MYSRWHARVPHTESGGAKMKQDKKAIRLPFLPREISQTCRHGMRREEGEDELGTCITNTHARMALRSAAMSISPTERVAAEAKDIAAAALEYSTVT